MMRSIGRPFWVYLLPVLHLCTCLIIAVWRIESGWENMLVIDFPLSAVVIAIIYNFNHPLLLFGTLGTLWWYLISRAIEMIYRRTFAKRLSKTEPSR
jgi:hypothetical protein